MNTHPQFSVGTEGVKPDSHLSPARGSALAGVSVSPHASMASPWWRALDWIRMCMWTACVSLSLLGAAGAVTLTDLVQPDLSGMSPAEMAAWFNDPTNVVGSSGEQIALIWQLCSSCRARIEQSGGNNYGMIYQNVDGASASIVQGGNGHQGIIQSSPGIAIIYQAPFSVGNIATIVQSDGSATLATWH